jgi:hypothetical protein
MMIAEQRAVEPPPIPPQTLHVTTYCSNCNNLKAKLERVTGAAREAKEYFKPMLEEPERTIFWKLVAALKEAEGKE